MSRGAMGRGEPRGGPWLGCGDQRAPALAAPGLGWAWRPASAWPWPLRRSAFSHHSVAFSSSSRACFSRLACRCSGGNRGSGWMCNQVPSWGSTNIKREQAHRNLHDLGLEHGTVLVFVHGRQRAGDLALALLERRVDAAHVGELSPRSVAERVAPASARVCVGPGKRLKLFCAGAAAATTSAVSHRLELARRR